MLQEETNSLKKKEVAEHFSTISGDYREKNYLLAGKRGKYPDIYRRHQYILEMIEGLQGTALEVGCGSGEMLCELLNRNFEVVGIDIAFGMLKASKALTEDQFSKKISLLLGDIENLSFHDQTFDIIIAAGVIEYLDSDKKIFPEFFRILKPGGFLILSVRNKVNLSHLITTTRDLLSGVPEIGKLISNVSQLIRRTFSLPPSSGFPGRRHIPAQIKRELSDTGLIPVDFAFSYFAIFPRFLERRFPGFCIRWGEKMEIFSKTILGYFGNQYIVKAQKVKNEFTNQRS
jgi:ubiquinone/menaquinone biosynthesis C-methylase UbiE